MPSLGGAPCGQGKRSEVRLHFGGNGSMAVECIGIRSLESPLEVVWKVMALTLEATQLLVPLVHN